VFNVQFAIISTILNYSGLPLWRRVEHLVSLKTDSSIILFFKEFFFWVYYLSCTPTLQCIWKVNFKKVWMSNNPFSKWRFKNVKHKVTALIYLTIIYHNQVWHLIDAWLGGFVKAHCKPFITVRSRSLSSPTYFCARKIITLDICTIHSMMRNVLHVAI